MTDLERIEAELREIKAILMILVPSYGNIEKEAAEIFGWNKKKERGMIGHATRGRGNGKADIAKPS